MGSSGIREVIEALLYVAFSEADSSRPGSQDGVVCLGFCAGLGTRSLERFMQVVATAGHKGHGKSSLVRALTRTDADRPDVGPPDVSRSAAGWTALPSGRRVAFVDAPRDEQAVPPPPARF